LAAAPAREVESAGRHAVFPPEVVIMSQDLIPPSVFELLEFLADRPSDDIPSELCDALRIALACGYVATQTVGIFAQARKYPCYHSLFSYWITERGRTALAWHRETSNDFIPANAAAKLFNVTIPQISRWHKDGKVRGRPTTPEDGMGKVKLLVSKADVERHVQLKQQRQES
jgi:hypothetical protein